VTFPDLHPEELLCPSPSRTLTPNEKADLDAHLQRCPACLLQRQLGPEIAHALPPTEHDYRLGARVAERVLGMSPLTITSAQAAFAPLFSPRSGSLRAWGRVAIVLFFLLGTAVGAQAIVAHLRTQASPPDASDSPRAKSSAPARTGRRPVGSSQALPAEESPPAAVPTTVEPPLVLSLKTQETPGKRRSVHPSPGAPDTRADSPASLFGRAELARLQRNVREANRLFRTLGLLHAGTREEIASRVLLGQLLLDDLRAPAEALHAFDRYLRDEPGGTLAEEARVGRGLALRQMGHVREEIAAWGDLLARHPGSIHGAAARARLNDLSPRP
jgi:hypothetical protein